MADTTDNANSGYTDSGNPKLRGYVDKRDPHRVRPPETTEEKVENLTAELDLLAAGLKAQVRLNDAILDSIAKLNKNYLHIFIILVLYGSGMLLYILTR